jgi:GNAT superfamily N-acetyltransferase
MLGVLKMTSVSYIEVDGRGLDRIKPLWEKLIEHMKMRSTYFCKWFATRTFEQRKAELLTKTVGGKLHIDLAMDEGQYVGYCVSSISSRAGEIDSIFVEESRRSSGIGSELMKRALSWMDDERVESVRIVASIGNEEVIPFYQHYGFYPKHTLLELIEEPALKK